MPKKLQELRQFSGGVQSSPSSSDINYEASIYSKNIDPISEAGKLKGSRHHRMVTNGDISLKLIWPKLTTPSTEWEASYPAANSNIWNPGNEGVLINSLEITYKATTVNGQYKTETFEYGNLVANTTNSHYDTYSEIDQICTKLKELDGVNAYAWYPRGSSNYTYWANESIGSFEGVLKFTSEVTINNTTYPSGTQLSTAQWPLVPHVRGINIELDKTKILDYTITFKTKDSSTEYGVGMTDTNTANEYIYTDNTAGFEYITDSTEYLNMNATEMELFNDEGLSNIAFFSKTLNDPNGPDATQDTYRMKVLEDIDGQRLVKESYEDEQTTETIYFDLENNPDTVSLTKKNSDVYIGTGNKLGDRPKWFGKIKHSQFDKKLNDYRLLDAELYPVDDGQSVFNLDHVVKNRHLSANDSIQEDKVYGISSGINKVFGIELSSTSSTEANKGVHTGSDNLTFTPTTITPSYLTHDALKGLSNGTWTIDSTDILQNYTHTNNQTAYWWAPDWNRSEIKLISTTFDVNTPSITVEVLRVLSVVYANGSAPPSGTRMTDIKECYSDSDGKSYIWCLYTKPSNTPFTYGEEFLYMFEWDDINWGANSVTLNPKTPTAVEAKKETNEGKTVYVNEQCFKAEWPTHDSWADGTWWDERANGFYWRKVNKTNELDPNNDDWERKTAKGWYNDGGTWDLGTAGLYFGDYSITPFSRGLVDLNTSDKHVALIADMEGSLVTKAGKLHATRQSSWPQRWFRMKVHTSGTLKSVSGTKWIFPRKEHHGVNHVRVSGQGQSGVISDNHFDETDDYTIRMGGFKKDNNSEFNLYYKNFGSATVSTGHEGFTDITSMPRVQNINSISPEIVSVSGQNFFWVTGNGEQANSTVLMSWNNPSYNLNPTSYHDTTISVKSVTGNQHQPTIFEDISNAVMTPTFVSNLGTKFFLSATGGTYINAEALYEHSNNTTNGWQVGSTDFGATWETTTNYPSNYASYIANSKLDYGLLIADGDVVSENPNFDSLKTYYYKISFLYDGYQESPLTNFFFEHSPNQDCNTLNITARMFKPSPRVTHMMVYRKNDVEDYYRLVEEVSFENAWGKISGVEEYYKVITDDGGLSATYESITGMPEVLRNTSVSYKLSCAAGGYLMVGNCNHNEIVNGQNFIFRSQPNNYSSFNWSKDYLVMPSEPTTLAYWANRLYVFDTTNMYKVEINGMVIEDTHYGVGCFGESSFVVTDYGMFFADKNNIYMHDGSRIVPLGDNIIKSAAYDDNTGIGTNNPSNIKVWHNINHAQDPVLAYDAFNQNIMVMWNDIDGTSGSWNYNLPRKRWDLIDIPKPEAYVQGPNSQRFLSDGSYFYELNAKADRDNYDYHSPHIDFGLSTVDKKIKKIKLVFSDATSRLNSRFKLQVFSDNAIIETIERTASSNNESEHILEYKIPTNKTKKLRLVLTNCNQEIDSIGITYLVGTVK